MREDAKYFCRVNGETYYLDIYDDYFRVVNAGCCVDIDFMLKEHMREPISFDAFLKCIADTVLSEKDIRLLYKLEKDHKIYSIGSPQREKQAKAFQKKVKGIIDKLNSAENDLLFEHVIEDEKAIAKDRWGLTYGEVDEIFDEYPLKYRDAGIIGSMFNDAEECGRSEMDSFYDIKHIENYIDFKKFGKDLCENECYHMLSSGRIVYYYM